MQSWGVQTPRIIENYCLWLSWKYLFVVKVEIFSGMATVTSNAEEVEGAVIRLVGDPGMVTEVNLFQDKGEVKLTSFSILVIPPKPNAIEFYRNICRLYNGFRKVHSSASKLMSALKLEQAPPVSSSCFKEYEPSHFPTVVRVRFDREDPEAPRSQFWLLDPAILGAVEKTDPILTIPVAMFRCRFLQPTSVRLQVNIYNLPGSLVSALFFLLTLAGLNYGDLIRGVDYHVTVLTRCMDGVFIVQIAPGEMPIAVPTDRGRCDSLLDWQRAGLQKQYATCERLFSEAYCFTDDLQR
uniref:Uncharacterized protein n=1 Tax=Parascaris equorum TaxID=6256 RepID=A0A914RU08_PAREQ